MNALEKLTERMFELVPEGEKLDLETCRVALRRDNSFGPTLETVLGALGGVWKDLESFSQQEEAHIFLYKYLCEK